MVLRLKSACAVAWNLNGVRSGLRTGRKLNIAASAAVSPNEANHLPAL